MKIGLPSMKNALMPLAKSVLILLGLIEAAAGKKWSYSKGNLRIKNDYTDQVY